MSRKVIYTILALNDMDNIFEYIKTDSLPRAEIFIAEIKSKITNLSLFLKLGKQLNENTYIYLINKNYLVYYKILNSKIYILSVKNVKIKEK